jgi:hypothetical protein
MIFSDVLVEDPKLLGPPPLASPSRFLISCSMLFLWLNKSLVKIQNGIKGSAGKKRTQLQEFAGLKAKSNLKLP